LNPKAAVAAFLVGFANFALAQEMAAPKVFKGLDGRKGEYKVELLERLPAAKESRRTPQMTVCTDNLWDSAKRAEKRATRDPDCKHRLLKDTDSEAVIESVCKERTSTVTLRRESAKSLLMDIASDGARGQRKVKMRYTLLGDCGSER
jgi:hypothetical protein